MKKFTLRFIQIAWPCEAILIILFTITATVMLDTERFNLWLKALPTIAGMILAQGTAAGGGPLVADAIKLKGEKGE